MLPKQAMYRGETKQDDAKEVCATAHDRRVRVAVQRRRSVGVRLVLLANAIPDQQARSLAGMEAAKATRPKKMRWSCGTLPLLCVFSKRFPTSVLLGRIVAYILQKSLANERDDLPARSVWIA